MRPPALVLYHHLGGLLTRDLVGNYNGHLPAHRINHRRFSVVEKHARLADGGGRPQVAFQAPGNHVRRSGVGWIQNHKLAGRDPATAIIGRVDHIARE